MKVKLIVYISVLFLLSGCKTKQPLTENIIGTSQSGTSNPSTKFMEQTTWILGYFTRDLMMRPPHSEWYNKGYDEYRPDSGTMDRLRKTAKDDLTVTIVLGSWCPDSRREVPRFLRITDMCGFPIEKITFIGVDNQKIAPVGEYEKLNIVRVPTFIFYKNNVEAGRIIEVPVTSLEQDMVDILTRE